jgi:hypothetical protein
MLGHNTAIKVDEYVGFRALNPLSLIARVQRGAVHASMQHVMLFIKRNSKFLKRIHQSIDQKIQANEQIV